MLSWLTVAPMKNRILGLSLLFLSASSIYEIFICGIIWENSDYGGTKQPILIRQRVFCRVLNQSLHFVKWVAAEKQFSLFLHKWKTNYRYKLMKSWSRKTLFIRKLWQTENSDHTYLIFNYSAHILDWYVSWPQTTMWLMVDVAFFPCNLLYCTYGIIHNKCNFPILHPCPLIYVLKLCP